MDSFKARLIRNAAAPEAFCQLESSFSMPKIHTTASHSSNQISDSATHLGAKHTTKHPQHSSHHHCEDKIPKLLQISTPSAPIPPQLPENVNVECTETEGGSRALAWPENDYFAAFDELMYKQEDVIIDAAETSMIDDISSNSSDMDPDKLEDVSPSTNPTDSSEESAESKHIEVTVVDDAQVDEAPAKKAKKDVAMNLGE